jgi:hypothetical protein
MKIEEDDFLSPEIKITLMRKEITEDPLCPELENH